MKRELRLVLIIGIHHSTGNRMLGWGYVPLINALNEKQLGLWPLVHSGKQLCQQNGNREVCTYYIHVGHCPGPWGAVPLAVVNGSP